MVASAVLGAATGTGLALLVAMTLVLYRYYASRRYGKDWGDVERFSPPKGWEPPRKSQGPKRAGSGYSVTTQKVFNVAKEEQTVQPSSPGGNVESVVPPLDLTGGLQATLCRTPSVSSHTSLDSTTSRQSLRSTGRTLTPESRSLSEASPLTVSRGSHRPVSPLLVPQDSTSSISSCRDAPPSPLPLGTLQPSLYTKPEGPLLLRAHNSVGRLHFNINYDFDRSDLHIHLIEGEDLAGTWSEPFVRLVMEPAVDARLRQTGTQPQPRPRFDQHFKFPVSHDQLQDKTLVMQVYDYDRYSRNDVVGEVKLGLGEVDVTSNLQVWADVAKILKPPEGLQEILISLSYLPSAERLTVVLLKAKNLAPPEHRDTVDPFVKVYLLLNGKRIKKKKTACRKTCNNPVWNEAITFNLSSSVLNNSAVEICVLDQGTDLLGGPSVLGSVQVGVDHDGAGGSHWAEMISSPRKAVAMWHFLR